ncbi:DoxX family protein [Alloacidobacterium sp.]|uniref:DoxX family protein n=1 Tax=Alloacidobacterium sp. TaxID=2951999 RepID=UPI002D395226|nr:DoxX family protein [Alloacidobacterium sp.]HYK36014.1 DoxX family protein [Alloacidobacterium sp.]
MFTWLDRFRPLAVLIARIVLGVIMIVHGWHKIFPRGSLYNFTQMVGHLGLPSWLGYVAAFTEFFGGALLILGLLVPIAAIGVVIDMAVAVLKVHLHHGLTGPMGFEFPLALLVLALLILVSGSGHLAVDSRLGTGVRRH